MISLGELAIRIGAQCIGDTSLPIESIADLRAARPGQISFLSSREFHPFLSTTKASAVITSSALAENYQGNLLLVDNPYLGYALAAQVLDDSPVPPVGIHPTAVVADNVELGDNISIGAYTVIESGVHIANNVIIGSQVYLGEGVNLGTGTRLYSGVRVYHSVAIGSDVTIHSGTVIGSDGFGYAPDGDQWVKIPQMGAVRIGDEVQIGANCTIDRGALEDTVIGKGVILDNLVHIAHNVSLGDNSALAAYSAVAGGTTIGRHCTLAGRVGVIGHLELCDNVHVTVNSLVSRSITEPGSYSSGDVAEPTRQWKRKLVRVKQLDTLFQRIKELEKKVEQLTQDSENK